MLKALLKKEWLEMTASLRRSSLTGRSRRGWKAVAFGVLAALLLAVVLGSVGVLAALLCVPLSRAGLDALYFSVMALPALLAGVMGGGFAAYGGLYCAKDNDQLLALPIPPGMILAVRMGGVGLLGAGYLTVILLPSYAVYFALGTRPLAAALAMVPVTLLLSGLVLAGSCLLGWAAAAVGRRVTRFKAVLSLLYAVLLLAFAFGSNFLVREGLVWLLTHLDEASARLRADAWLIGLVGRAASGRPAAVGQLALVCLPPLAAAWLVLRRSYLRIMTAQREATRAVYREKVRPARSLRAALLGRELRHLAASTSYMVNGLLASLLLVPAAVAALWKREELRRLAALLPEGLGPPLLCLGLCSVLAMNLLTPPSVSLEGRSLWLLRSLPVTPWQALRAKLDLHLVLTLPPALLASLCLLWALGWGGAAAALVLAGAVLFTLFAGAAGLALGVRLVNLHWTNETAAIKQGLAPVTTLLGGWAAVALLAGLWVLTARPLGPLGALALCDGVLAAGCLGLLAWLRRGGAAAFARLEG